MTPFACLFVSSFVSFQAFLRHGILQLQVDATRQTILKMHVSTLPGSYGSLVAKIFKEFPADLRFLVEKTETV